MTGFTSVGTVAEVSNRIALTPPHQSTIPVPITFPPDDSVRAVASLKRYCAEELDVELGDLPGKLLLEFILSEIGPSIYNRGVADAQVYLRDRVAEVDGACYEPEFTHWTRPTGNSRRK